MNQPLKRELKVRSEKHDLLHPIRSPVDCLSVNRCVDLPVARFLSSAPPPSPVASLPRGPALGQEVTKCRSFRRSLAVVWMGRTKKLMVSVNHIVLGYFI